MRSIIRLSIYIFIIAISSQVNGQELSSDLQEVVKSFEAQLEEANKIQIKPVIVSVLPVKKKYLYSVTIVPLEIKYAEPVIKPISTEPDLPFTSHPFLLKAGYGNIKNPKVDLLYYKTDQNKLDYYLSGHHYELDNSTKVTNQKMSDTEIGVGAKVRIKENHIVEFNSKADVENRGVFFIYTPFEPIDGKTNRRRLNITNDISIRNIDKLESKIEYKTKLTHSLLRVTNQNVNENKFKLESEVAKLSDNYSIKFPISLSGIQQTNISDLYSVNFTPHLKLNNKKYLFKGGLAVNYDNEIKTTKFWPIVMLDYALSGKKLHIYTGSDQTQVANDLHRLSEQNSFIQSRLSKLSNSIVQSISTGVRGETVSLAYQGEVSYNIHENFTSFNNTDSATYYFANAVFNKVNYLQVKFSSDFAISRYFSVGGLLIKNFYSTKEGVSLYGINSLDLSANAKLRLFKDKFILKPMLTIHDRSTALVYNENAITEEIQLNNQADLSIHADILFGKFGIYGEANNVLNNKFARWYGFPNVGINFNAGVILKL